MSDGAPRLRQRVHEAIEEPVEQAEKLLSDVPDADGETKLSILISGWARGFAAALEELAIAIDDLRASSASPASEPAERNPPRPPRQTEPVERSTESERGDTGPIGDERLLDDAKKSREATAELRREAEQVRDELER